MIPLRSTERVHSTAFVTGTLIAINLAIFLYQTALPSYAQRDFIETWGIVPDRLRVITMVTSMFLHGGWMHLLGNMLFLWVFGRNMEDLIGGARFLTFYLACGILAAIAHVVVNIWSPTPTIGASGAIAGVMGAYLIKFPRARIITLVPVIIFITTMEIPAWLLLLYWFGLQFLGTLTETSYGASTGGGTAWLAHIGGFVSGMLVIRMFPERQRWRRWQDE